MATRIRSMRVVFSPTPDFASGLSGARVLVTGGSGFIGTNLVGAYKSAGIAVTSLDLAEPRNPGDRDVWRRVDVRRLDDLRAAFAEVRPTHVFHLAARTDLDGQTLEDYDANVGGVANVLSVLRDSPVTVARTVFASSRLVCRIGYQPASDEDYCPTTPYGASKVETERLVRASQDIPWVLARPTSIWGPWFDVPYRDFFLSVARGRYVHPRGKRIHKSFGFVGNTTWQLHKLMTAPDEKVLGRTFYLADDPPIEVRDLADRIRSTLGRRRTTSVPLPVLSVLARAGDAVERTGHRAPLTSFRLANLLTPMIHDLTPLAEVAGSPPYTLDLSVPATVEWMRSQGLVDGA